MTEDFRDQFLENRASESNETAWVGYYNTCTSPHETGFETDARIWRKCKNKLMVKEANFLETVHWNWLKMLRHVAITPL